MLTCVIPAVHLQRHWVFFFRSLIWSTLILWQGCGIKTGGISSRSSTCLGPYIVLTTAQSRWPLNCVMRPPVSWWLQPKRGSNFPLSLCVILSTSATLASLGGLHVTPSVSINCARSPLFLLPHQKWGPRCIDIQQRLLWTLVNNSGRILERATMTEGEGAWPEKTSPHRPLKEMLIPGPVSFFFLDSLPHTVVPLCSRVSLRWYTLYSSVIPRGGGR